MIRAQQLALERTRMAKRKANKAVEETFFDIQQRAFTQLKRRQRALLIRKRLADATARHIRDESAFKEAHKIAIRWAELESAGHLPQYRETTVDTQFLDQVFGQGLGYRVKTASPDRWELEHKFSVPGIGTADGALGGFPVSASPLVLIELKGAGTDLDRDRFSGRTAVQQCWDYLSAFPGCPWGIVSNFSIIRLYHRDRTRQVYEEFTLQGLRNEDTFKEFYYLFERGGLLPGFPGQKPRAIAILEDSERRQKEVGDELYGFYQQQRLLMIDHLMTRHGKSLDSAIHAAQKLLDRVIFIAFCQSRELLPEKCLEKAYTAVPAFARVTNPRWHNFIGLFRRVDEGDGAEISKFNGGLFEADSEVDNLELPDEPWTRGFKDFGEYDFSEEVNVDVLGHLFERSITELEKLRIGGKYALLAALEQQNGNGASRAAQTRGNLPARGRRNAAETAVSRMPKSAQRKRFGIYYTPPAFTNLIVERTVDAFVRERFAGLAQRCGIDPEARSDQPPQVLADYWRACWDDLQRITVCDPACGSGAFLIRAYDALDAHYRTVAHGLGGASLSGAGVSPAELNRLEESIPDLILRHNLFGVDLSKEGVEITQLALWIRSARRGKTLADLSHNIRHGNSLVSDSAVDPKALDWQTAFPQIFADGGPGGFSCVIGNPPWERVKVQEREFFSLTDPHTAEAVSAAQRRKRIEAMPEAKPELHASYLAARDKAQQMLDYARRPADSGGRYPLTGKGDLNLYMLFAELARTLVAPDGIVGLLVPSGIATDDTTKEFFQTLMRERALISLYDFENRDKVFEDVDSRFKFSALVFGGSHRKTDRADFVFFAHGVDEVAESNKQRHIPLTEADMKLLNPNTRTCPIFRTRRDAEITKAIYKRVPILIDESRRQGGNPWGVKFLRMFDQTNDAEQFHDAAHWRKEKFKLSGNEFVHGKRRALPLYEAKMVQAFDHRAASVLIDEENWVRQGQKDETTPVEHANPEFGVLPRWWVDESAVAEVMNGQPGNKPWFVGFKDITSPTNERTMIASFIPRTAVTNKFVLALNDAEARRETCLLGNLNSFIFDYVTRQKIGGITLNFFIVEQLPTLPPDIYSDKCPWSKRETLQHWIGERVLKLSCTAEDMIPLARACDFKGSRGDGVHIWKETERVQLRAELDAAFFILYGIDRDDVEYILSTFTNTGEMPSDQRATPDDRWRNGGVGETTLAAYDALRNQM